MTWDFSECALKTERQADFLRDQRDVEINAGRYSESFGAHLLPGMYSTLVGVILKPCSESGVLDVGLVVDPSLQSWL